MSQQTALGQAGSNKRETGDHGGRVRLPANGWQPRPYQLDLWSYLEAGGKRAVAIWHRRAGKDDVALNWAAVSSHQRVGNVWHCLPEFAQARKAIWTAVNPHTGKRRIDEAFPHELRANTNDQEMFIRFKNGSTWQVIGSDNYQVLVGTPPIGIVFSEWAKANPAAWAYLAPILAENGGWAVWITTPQGRNHAKRTLDMGRESPHWFAEVQTVDDTGAIDLAVVEEQRREYHSMFGEDEGDALIEQEYYCSFNAAILGSYYGKAIARLEAAGRITSVPYDEALPVHTAWDLGIGDSTAIWFFQVVANEVRVVDFYQASGHALSHYVEKIGDRLAEKGGYLVGKHYVPHDARARELGTGRSRLETLIDLKINPSVLPNQRVEEGINAARVSLPFCWFDAKRCEEGIECLRQYRKEWDEKERVFKNTPKHDFSSHAADAARYMFMGWRELKAELPRKQPTNWTYVADPITGRVRSTKTIHEIIKERERRARREL